MKRIISLAISVLLLLGSVCVYASPDNELNVVTDYSTGVTTISAEVGEKYADRWVNVLVLNPGYTVSNLYMGTIDAINWATQTRVDSKGKFSVKMSLIPSEISDDPQYTVIVGIDTMPGTMTKKTELYNTKYVNNVLSQLQNAISASDKNGVSRIIDDYSGIFDILQTNEYGLYTGFSQAKKDRVHNGIIKENPRTTLEFKEVFTSSVLSIMLDEISDADDYIQSTRQLIDGMAESVKDEIDSMKSTELEELARQLMTKNYDCPSDIEAEICKIIILDRINSSKLWTEIASVYLKYSDALGIDTEAYDELKGKKEAITELIGKDFATVPEAASAFDDEVRLQASRDKKEDKSTSKGGSGGNGGGGGVVGTPITIVKQEEQNPTTVDKTTEYDDLYGYEWAKEDIIAMSSAGIVKGVGNRMFAPGREITRAEFVKLITTAFGIKYQNKNHDFDDVKPGDWYYECVMAAYDSGVVNGISETSFAPGAFITRQDMAAILDRCTDFEAAELEFDDSSDIADYAKKAVGALSASGIMNGKGQNRFCPADNASRAEAVVTVARILKLKGVL